MKVDTKAELRRFLADLKSVARSLISLIAGQEDKLVPIIAQEIDQELKSLSKQIDKGNFKEVQDTITRFERQLPDWKNKGVDVKRVKSELLELEKSIENVKFLSK